MTTKQNRVLSYVKLDRHKNWLHKSIIEFFQFMEFYASICLVFVYSNESKCVFKSIILKLVANYQRIFVMTNKEKYNDLQECIIDSFYESKTYICFMNIKLPHRKVQIQFLILDEKWSFFRKITRTSSSSQNGNNNDCLQFTRHQAKS